MPGRLARGDVHLYQFAPPDKRRPVVILTRDDVINQIATATVAPISSTIRGVLSEVFLDVDDGMKGPCVVNTLNLLLVRQDLLGPRVGSLSDTRMKQICAAIHFSLGCD